VSGDGAFRYCPQCATALREIVQAEDGGDKQTGLGFGMGRSPEGLHNFLATYLRFCTHVRAYAFLIAETGFDPAQINDLYSTLVLTHIFDAPYAYDYLARPVKVKPNTAAGLPEVSADGRTWTIRIRPGIFFADDAAFKGKRELTAHDYVYSLKRHFDPKVKSPNLYLVHKLIAGMDEVRQSAQKSGRFDYDREVEGIDMIHTGDDGLIDDFTVMVRPLSAALALRDAVGDQLGLTG